MKIINNKLAFPIWKFIYLLAAIVLPSIGATLFVILQTFTGNVMFKEALFWLIFLISLLVQIIFLVIFYFFIKKQTIDNKFRKRQIIFFLCMVLILAPLMFAVSITSIDLFNHYINTYSIAEFEKSETSPMVELSGLPITSEFFTLYSRMNLTLLSLFAGFFVGLLFMDKIQKERKLKMLIYFFGSIIGGAILALVAVAVFIMLHWILFALFGTLI